MTSNYDKQPIIHIKEYDDHCWTGWESIIQTIRTQISSVQKEKIILVIDCYHGVYHNDLISAIKTHLPHSLFVETKNSFKPASEIEKMVYPDVTDDRIFGRITTLNIKDYFSEDALLSERNKIDAITEGLVIIYGEGATYLHNEYDLLVYADMARWEIQQRFRRNEISNLGIHNPDAEFSRQYKQSYFVDWRVCDKHKQQLMNHWDFVLDTNDSENPKLLTAAALSKGLEEASNRPFRVVPFFDPGPWGGQWMKEFCDLDRSKENYAWCFDCVPEENSLLLGYGNQTIEIPSINLVFEHPEELLGAHTYKRFGKEFPIRFDFLDTMGGGNLSLQVHPTKAYIKEHFGMDYTQDESYYLLDAEEGAFVYLGLKENINKTDMIDKLKAAQNGGDPFDADQFVEKWPVQKHDHVLIPEGTIHCSGKDSMVLEISATPYIFTFKLWDWERMGLDGKPRPINIERGQDVINWNYTTPWTKQNIYNAITKVESGKGWTEEKTGLHETQFIETRRHWFTDVVAHHTNGSVNVLNLVEGREAIIESPTHAFEPFVVHYAETFIIPAKVNAYTIRPYGESIGEKCATIKAFVRD
ncbi:class I mannose-6-phosphate isomerase [Bacteroidota bacterium]